MKFVDSFELVLISSVLLFIIFSWPIWFEGALRHLLLIHFLFLYFEFLFLGFVGFVKHFKTVLRASSSWDNIFPWLFYYFHRAFGSFDRRWIQLKLRRIQRSPSREVSRKMERSSFPRLVYFRNKRAIFQLYLRFPHFIFPQLGVLVTFSQMY